MELATREPARVERAFAGVYGSADTVRLAAAVRRAGPTSTAAPHALTVAWSGAPAQASPRNDLVACLMDGEIYNLEDIAKLAEVPSDTAPESVLAAAYGRVGEELLTYLRGEFALLIWDGRTREGLLACDQLGAGSVFVHTGVAGLCFASELAYLLDALPRRPAPDNEALVRWLASGTVPPGRTLYEGVRRVAPASFLRLHAGRWQHGRYWSPRYVERPRLDRDEAACEVREAVIGAVGRRLRGRRAAGVLVSGGLDSGTVLAAAGHVAARSHTSLHTYSAVFPGHPSMDESELVAVQVAHHGLPHMQRTVTRGSPLAGALRYLDRWGVPLPVPGHFLWEPLLVAAARDGAECMLDGELGDEVFGAAVFLIADRLRHGRLRGAVRLARSFPAAGPSPSRRLLLSALYDYGIAVCLPSGLSRVTAARTPTPSWLSRDEARRYAQSRDPQPWRSLEGPRWWRQLADALTRGPDRLGFFDYFRRRGRAVGVPAHHPFADLELIELVLTLPPEHAFAPDLSRPLLRHAMRGLLPDEIRARRGKSYFDPLLVDCLAGCDRRVIGALLSPRHAEVLRFADPTAIRLLLDRGPAGHPRGAVPWMRDVWRLATAECWLRSQSNPEIAHAILDELSHPLEGGASGWRPRAGSPARSYVSQP